MRSLALLALLTALAPCASAQRLAHTPQFHSPSGRLAFAPNSHPSAFRRPSPLTSLPFPLLGDSFNLQDLYSSGYPVASAPPLFLVQAASALSSSSQPPAPSEAVGPGNDPSQPLMIELQNGRYGRVANSPADSDALPLPLASSAAAAPFHDLPPAILIFRDGHSEEVRDYTIANGFLYARGDYYTNGYWNKKIDLATLNVTQTLQANHTRNTKFALPTSPTEVITRP